jgi:hypothetical protein
MKPGETDTERKAVYFTVYDSDGLLASGNAGEGAVCAPSGSELQWKRATGTAYANSAGAFAHVGDGLYRYIPADAEVASAEGEAVAVIKLKKTGYSTQFVPVPILYSVDTTSASSVATAVLAATIHTGYSVARALRIIGGAVAGKLSGAATNAPVMRFLDDSGDAVTGVADDDGNRTTATHGA